MKIGIITDLHSNVSALKAVLKEFSQIKVDKIICCGDIIGIGINPEETVQELIKIKDKLIAVRGNHEQYLLNGLPKQVHNDKKTMSKEEIENHVWNHNRLSEQSIKFLSDLKLSQTIEDIEGKKIFIIHYPQENDGTYKKLIKNPSNIEIKEMFQEYDADIFLYGHTHTYFMDVLDNKWYINPGSLGCPMNSNIAKAGLLEINNGVIEFKSINVEYNVKEVIEKINKLKNPFYKEVLKIFYGNNL